MSTFTEAVEVLVIRRTQKARPNDPDAYGASVRKDLRHRLQDQAKAITAEDPGIDPKALADQLDPGSLVAPAYTPTDVAPQPEPYEADEWAPLEPDHVAHAKAKIAQIRATLNGDAA